VLYYAVAAWTTGVRGPVSLFDYLTFFHRAGGNNFFEASGAAIPGRNRLVRAAVGLSSFFAGGRIAKPVVLVGLFLAVLWPVALRRSAAAQAGPALSPSTLWRHALLLGGLWSAHFLFFEPQNFESWTLAAALLVLVVAVGLPAGRLAWVGALLPAFLLVSNQPHYIANHRELDLASSRRVVARQTHPGDIVLLVGGLRNQIPLDGSRIMRYFLATQPQRTFVSLYDVAGFTQTEYWGRPFGSPAALQEAITSGRRVYMPAFLQDELLRGNASGLVQITWVAHGDSLLEITHLDTPAAR
jgi:hypothetical protein